MWKKIGIKNESPLPTVETPRYSNDDSNRSRSYKRMLPLDERSLVEKDSNNSRISGSSSRVKEEEKKSVSAKAGTSGSASQLFYSQTLKEPGLLTSPSNFRISNKEDEARHMVSCDVLPRYNVSKQESKKKPHRMSDQMQEIPMKSSQTSMIEELDVSVMHNQRLVQDYVERLQKELKTSRRLNQHYQQKLKEYRTFATVTRKEAAKELEAVKFMMRMSTDQICKQLKKVSSPQHAGNTNTKNASMQTEEGLLYGSAKVTLTEAPSCERLQAQDQNYCQEIQNVMGKIDELKQSVQETKNFKKDIINRIDANLRRAGGVRKTRGFERN